MVVSGSNVVEDDVHHSEVGHMLGSFVLAQHSLQKAQGIGLTAQIDCRHNSVPIGSTPSCHPRPAILTP